MISDAEIRAFCQRYDAGDSEGDRLARSVISALQRRRAQAGKACARCREFKPLREFARDVYRVDGLRTYCRTCSTHIKKERRN